ncbi:uncharacterized protein LOC129594697 [Paramacrobiotus metropolitanus]|uniref:uncharacterized protein LOC129594697 n=1 Tax=Paramacrobiotus metropolitanus TaxID=2943436 RepID=UPI0024459716|nr:uncharacterized protein LOC129594697 [Paramacrobiotus metropolitanus]
MIHGKICWQISVACRMPIIVIFTIIFMLVLKRMSRYCCILAGISALLAATEGQQQSTCATFKGCGIPVVVNTVNNPDPLKFAGTWYTYRQTGAYTVNPIFKHVTMKTRTALPYSNTPAVALYLQIAQYSSASDTQCVHRFFVGMCVVSGQCPGKMYSSVDGYIPSAVDFSLLYGDPDDFYVVYVCDKPNHKTGMCDSPSFHVVTRTRPDYLTTAQSKSIDDTIDAILGPYCISTADIPLQAHNSSVPYCPFLDDLPPCIQGVVTGLTNEVANTISN